MPKSSTQTDPVLQSTARAHIIENTPVLFLHLFKRKHCQVEGNNRRLKYQNTDNGLKEARNSRPAPRTQPSVHKVRPPPLAHLSTPKVLQLWQKKVSQPTRMCF